MEDDSGVDLVLEVVAGHVGVGEAVGGDDAFVGLGSVVDYGVDLIEVLGGAGADHVGVSSAKDEDCYGEDSRLLQRASGKAVPANAHLSDDETVAKMGHPATLRCDLYESSVVRTRRNWGWQFIKKSPLQCSPRFVLADTSPLLEKEWYLCVLALNLY